LLTGPHPLSLALQPAQPASPFSPANPAAPFTLPLPLACGPCVAAHPYPLTNPPRHRAAPARCRSRHTRSRGGARPGRPAAHTPRGMGAPARESSRAGERKDPFAPAPCLGVPETQRRGQAAPGRTQLGQPREFALPCGAVGSKARGGGPVAVDHRHQPTLGFCPFQSSAAEEEEEGGKVGEEVEERWGLVSRAAAGASPPRSDEYARSRTRGGAPYVTEEEPDRSRGPSTAGSACYATPSTFTTRLRLHRRPAVSAVAFSFSLVPSPFLVSVCGRAFEPPVAERVAPPSPHGRRRVAPCRRRPGAVATPSRVDRAFSLCLVFGRVCWRG
jgi:hypothetical protein